ncbi:MAG: hypothetical protein WCG27_01410 [Pseudomonadota bacterium]
MGELAKNAARGYYLECSDANEIFMEAFYKLKKVGNCLYVEVMDNQKWAISIQLVRTSGTDNYSVSNYPITP